jgi:ankyrin repeat protein
MWWSFDKNGHYVLLQQSPNKADVLDSVFDVNKEKIGPRLLPVKELTTAQGKYMSLEDLLESILYSSQLSTVYHVWSANCQKFASYVFQTANGEGKKWKTLTCGSLPDEKETLFGAGVNAIRYDLIAKQDKLIPYYQAILEKEGLPEFKRILSNYSGEFINQVDCYGYTMLDWARAFSRDDLENYLIEDKVAVHQPTDSKSSRQNIFHIALQYLDSKKDDAKLCFDGIDLASVNSIGDSALHLALYGGKWRIAMEILKKMKKLSMPVDITNRKGETIIHVIAKLACPPTIFAEILDAIPKEKGGMTDDEGFNALHWATKIGSPRKIKSLLENGADVNAESEDGDTALDLAMQDELNLEYKNKIVEQLLKYKAKGNTDDAGFTPLHLAIMEDEIAIEQIRKMMEMCPDDVDLQDHYHGDTPLMTVLDNQSNTKTELLLEVANVNIQNKKGMTGLHYAAMWPTIPKKLFEKILSQSTDLNAKNNEGDTALHWALREKSAGAALQLLRAENVDANIRNEKNEMAIHLAEKWENIPIEISKLIREKTTVM